MGCLCKAVLLEIMISNENTQEKNKLLGENKQTMLCLHAFPPKSTPWYIMLAALFVPITARTLSTALLRRSASLLATRYQNRLIKRDAFEFVAS